MVINNRRVKNATPLVYDGIRFRSKLEVYCYRRLKECNIEAEYESKTFILQPKFTFITDKIRPITYTPDFVGDTFIIECKGVKTDAFKLKWKMFLYLLFTTNITRYKLYMPKNQKEVEITLNNILNVNN